MHLYLLRTPVLMEDTCTYAPVIIEDTRIYLGHPYLLRTPVFIEDTRLIEYTCIS